jgi:DNA cross-link repair 1A protein
LTLKKGLAKELNIKVMVTKEKKKILDCIEDELMNSILVVDPLETFLHVLPMSNLNTTDLTSYLSKYKTKYDNLIAIKPTGWTHQRNNTINTNPNEGIKIVEETKNIKIYGLEYSEHSSFSELKTCVQTLKPRKIIPTVNVHDKKQSKYFDQWLERENNVCLNKWFKSGESI